MNKEKIAWAAGLFEGEGYISKDTVGYGCRLGIAMTDGDVVESFINVFNRPGKLSSRKRGSKYKTIHEWYVNKFEDVQFICVLMWPWLKTRRRTKIKEVLLNARLGRLSPGSGIDMRRTSCKKGHDFSSKNTYINPKGRRICRTCILIYQRKYRSKGKT